MINRRWIHSGPPNYPFTLNRESPQARGLVGWWPTSANQGGILHEFIYKNYGIFPGGSANPSLLPVVERGHALYYDGDDYIASIKNAPIFGDTPFSLVCWANTDDTGDTSANAFLYTAMQIGTHNAAGRSALINFNEDSIRFSGHSVSSVIYSPPSPINGIWTHIVGTYEGSGVYNLYVNGKLADGNTDVDAFDIAVQEVHIGSYRGASVGRFFEGYLDDCRIYNHALTPIEVYQLYAPQTRWELYQPLYRLQSVRVATIISLNTLTLASSPQALSVTVDEIVALNELTLVSSAETLTVIPGSVTVALNELTLASSVEALMVLTGLTIAMTSLTLTGTGESLTVVSGAALVTINTLTLAISAPSLTVIAVSTQTVLVQTLILTSDTPNLIFAALIVIVFDFNITRAVTFDMGVG